MISGRTSPAGRAILTAKGIEKSYRPRLAWRQQSRVLRGVDLELFPGQIVALVGENGAGKSTLLRILVGLETPDLGELRRVERVGYCPQEAALYARLTVREHFRLFGSAVGLSVEQINQAAEELLDQLSFAQYADSVTDELSLGTKAKLNLALALLGEPRLVLLDEPHASFDWDTYLRFWELAKLRRQDGTCIVIVSHRTDDTELCDQVYNLSNGKLGRVS
ncbi:ABC transporter ATP-binding protein [Protofrankia coriariae]|uniref:ATP-binding cassette domain-containing protein n=1 Tax=Protofrankia coriariae TaxID=1562887 RepID=UPI000A3297D8